MKYTEEVKTEAERVVNTYSFLTEHFGNFDVLCAIQDRQSVLDALDYLSRNNIDSFLIDKEIQSLTQQIEYLKSKL